MTLRALLWDVDGTLAETERDGHRVAFDAAFESLGLPWRWSAARYGELLAVTGGRERLLHDMTSRPDAPAAPAERERLARELHARKNALYARIVAEGGIGLRPGVRQLIDEARASGVRQAITTTTSRANVEALLRANLGARWAEVFEVVVCGEDVERKKPDPEVFALALVRLRLEAHHALALEDSPAGASAAVAAGVPVVVTRSVYFAHEPITGALATGPGLHQRNGWLPPLPPDPRRQRVALADLDRWHRRA